jgi:ABC-2 type transport system permease protein
MNIAASQSPKQSDWGSNWMKTFPWLIRRELWEHRSLYVAPLIFAGLILAGVVIAYIQHGQFQIVNIQLDSPNERVPDAVRLFVLPMFFVPFALIAAVVGIYYSLDSLFADRRDRSVLFWKSLPVSDWETVLAKLFTAAVIVPAIAMAVSIMTALVLMVFVSIVFAVNGHSLSLIWGQIPIFQNLGLLLYAVVVNALWYLPFTAWCMLASAWARRAVFLWAAAPIAAVIFLEYQVFGTRVFVDLLQPEGGLELALNVGKEVFNDPQSAATTATTLADVITPGRFFFSIDLWAGLAVAAGLVAAAVWMRRYREAN